MKFKINLKPPKDLEIGDIIQICSGGGCYVVTEFRSNEIGKRVWGVPVNGGKLTHLFGFEYFREHLIEGKIKIMHYV